MMTSRWGENREGHNPGTVLLVSVESQNTAPLCCGFHLIIVMSRKKQSPILRLAHNYRSRRNIGICLESDFGNGGNKAFFWNTKRFICFKKGKTRRDIKIGSGFCKISLFYKGWPWLLGWVLPSPSYYWELIWMLSVIQLTFNPAQLCNQCVDLIIKICL